jgi:hypothetical protein
VKRVAFSCVVAALAGALSGAEPKLPPGTSPILNPEREGRELADQLRTSPPNENSEFTGVLEITSRDGEVRLVPIVSTLTVNPTNWHVVYRTIPSSETRPETLTIIHSQDHPNTYSLAEGTNSATPISQLNQPFAGSDFWPIDLGLEFLHWPQQRAIRAEMTRGRACRVLESINPDPAPGIYSKVISWVDVETGGILQADAYDGRKKLLKKFALGPIKKIDGQWKLREMRIRNTQTGQQTELKFDLKNE